MSCRWTWGLRGAATWEEMCRRSQLGLCEHARAILSLCGWRERSSAGSFGFCVTCVCCSAGGLRYVRYGSLHGSVLGMEMVLADGTVVDNLATLRKDNTGYDIKQLFIGAEGTLGSVTHPHHTVQRASVPRASHFAVALLNADSFPVCLLPWPRFCSVVTKLSILAARKPKCQHVAVLGCASYAAVLKTMQMARSDLLEIVSAVEFWDRASLDLVIKHIPSQQLSESHTPRATRIRMAAQGLLRSLTCSLLSSCPSPLPADARDPLSSPFPFYMLVETSGADSVHDHEKLSRFLERAMTEEIVLDGTVAQDTTQARSLWQLRETITEGLAKEGTVYKYDISLPVARMYDMVEAMKARLGSSVGGVVGYGHLGDGNLHLNIHTPKFDANVLNRIEPWLFEQTALERGSVSAEHGMGLSKAEYMPLSKSPEMIEIMRKVKQLFDPKGIINPYKVLPPTSAASAASK